MRKTERRHAGPHLLGAPRPRRTLLLLYDAGEYRRRTGEFVIDREPPPIRCARAGGRRLASGCAGSRSGLLKYTLAIGNRRRYDWLESTATLKRLPVKLSSPNGAGRRGTKPSCGQTTQFTGLTGESPDFAMDRFLHVGINVKKAKRATPIQACTRWNVSITGHLPVMA